ncbi:MAG: indole-3-glycerol phosphate synthase TrpC [Terriglobales bacterium]
MPHPAQIPSAVPHVLERILTAKRQRLAEAQQQTSEAELRLRGRLRTARDFATALAVSGPLPAIIAELKQASPSKGVLRAGLDVPVVARSYELAGAAALSVLTEEDFFQGGMANLALAREACNLPLLRKDFLFDPYQVWEAVAGGADAILLIVAMLAPTQIHHLLKVSHEAGLDVLVEVHDRAELEIALAAGARMVGVNNRDLRTFQVDPARALELRPIIPQGVVTVAESGIRSHDDLWRLRDVGYDAVLIGEHFMTAPDPGLALSALLNGERPGE